MVFSILPRRINPVSNLCILVPIASVASSLNLTLHRIPAFEPDSPSLPDPDANLLIAVSFGLKIPASVISSLQFGGLNVHPSLLPMFRGAAPIQRTILQHTPIGGVTIQTLHPTKFDRGEILKQTNPPMEIPATVSFVELREKLAKEGARLLVETLREGLYDSDLAKPGGGLKTGYPESLARKVGSQDARVVWGEWTKHELVQRADMFGDVWTMMGDVKLAGKGEKRVLLDGFEVIDNEDVVKSEVGDLGVGEFRMWKSRVKGGDLGKPEPWMVLKCRDGWVRVGGVKVEGKKRIDGGEWVQGLHDRGVGKMFI